MRYYARSYHIYKDIWEASTENSYYANTRVVTVLIHLLWCQIVKRVLYRLFHI